MMKIDSSFVNNAAPNQDAVNRGRDIVRKGGLVRLNITPDESLLFGECSGSGAKNYMCSADFIEALQPVFRCSCPSRQIPCKHVLALLLARADGAAFKKAELPADILEKRNKKESAKERKAKAAPTGPKKVNKAALKKKIEQQIKGVDLAMNIVLQITENGISGVNRKQAAEYRAQVKQLDSYYINGIQTAFYDFLLLFSNVKTDEQTHINACAKLSWLYQLCKRGKARLEKRLEDPEMALDPSTPIDELIGHVWQLSELKDLGLMENNAELVQLSFNSYSDYARGEEVDLGLWMNLKSGKIYENRTYRPFRARNHIKEEDSFSGVALIKELFVYPGFINPRARWSDMLARKTVSSDIETIHKLAEPDLEKAVKSVKDQLRNPLAPRMPVSLIAAEGFYFSGNRLFIKDRVGNVSGLAVPDASEERVHPELLPYIKTEASLSVLLRFYQDLETDILHTIPLAAVNDEMIISLVY